MDSEFQNFIHPKKSNLEFICGRRIDSLIFPAYGMNFCASLSLLLFAFLVYLVSQTKKTLKLLKKHMFDFFKRASRKIHQRSHRFFIWNRIVIMWRNFVQKERNNRITFSAIIMEMGKYFPCKWGKKSTFSRELPEKSTRGHTDFIFGIEPPTFAKIEKILKIRYLRYQPVSESR
jgi:hypothetical protein